MSEYFLLVFAATAMISIASLGVYSEAQQGATRLALGIITACVLLSPTVSLIEGLLDTDLSSESAEVPTVYEKTAEEAFALGVEAALKQEFSVPDGQLSVRVVGFSAERMSCERIILTLSGGACLLDPGGLRAFVEENNLGRCEVNFSFE